MFGTKENDIKYFVLTGVDKSTFFLQTSKFQTALDLIIYSQKNCIVISQMHTETVRQPIAYSPGYFISAQEVNEERVSSKYNKLWEIL